ncbi:DNA segregation protein [Candidatus Symbiobacter mobilis CR]|uniref:DNA segregation protein n=2 Tax=Candidatus Symbiobacter TaxID=1436289 RepID=U5N7P6_9BURK|nr:DNA segregation protein [Candidatus Symbiobacter mobilis CR]
MLCLLGAWIASLATFSRWDDAWSYAGPQATVSNLLGTVGAWVADISYFWLGASVWWGVALGVRWFFAFVRRWLYDFSWLVDRRAGSRPGRAPHWWRPWATGFGVVLLFASSTSLEWNRLHSLESYLPGHSGGVLGYVLGPWLLTRLGDTWATLLCISLILVGASLAFRFSWLSVSERIGGWLFAQIDRQREQWREANDSLLGQQAAIERARMLDESRHSVLPPNSVQPPLSVPPPAPTPPAPPAPPSPQKTAPQPVPQAASDRAAVAGLLPPFDLLDPPPTLHEDAATQAHRATMLESTSRAIEQKLRDFGVSATVLFAQPGPVITRYDIEPSTGVKGAQIVGLAKDLARSLGLVSLRVVETIPGKKCMALELPNPQRKTIYLREILDSPAYRDAASLLTIGLGKDIVGAPVVADLAKMPHVLVAGTTGAGKSVGINAMILSLLYKATAEEVRLLMIDPKMLEMSVYEGIPHLLCPVVTDMKQASHALNWCVGEMERRYRLMSHLGVRNLAGFNARIDEAFAQKQVLSNPLTSTPDEPDPLQRLPYIVVVIDELADLMMVVGKKVEELIARLAQKARAAGIHLILATQRPSVDVITGLIKANVPTRIAFQVSSKIDSRTILDQMGAEALLGMGDMLYMSSGSGLPLRVHGAFVSDGEVHRVVQHLKRQGAPEYVEDLLDAPASGGTVGVGDTPATEGGEADPLYDQAVAIVLQNRKASISLVQRHLRIGYNRSARLLEDMEKAGLVSAPNQTNQREVLVPADGAA